MAKEERITAVGYITVTGIASVKGRKTRNIHTVRLGFAGAVLRSGLRKMSIDLKKSFEKQLRMEYSDSNWNLKMASRVTIT